MLETIRERLALYRPVTIEPEGRARAAVLIPLYPARGELHVVLTKRSARVGRHAGEISFPGGAWDPFDHDLVTTALRECDEEIGLCPDDVEVIGRMDDLVTISDFHVTAFVGEIDPAACPCLWRPQVREVAEILEVPLSHLLDASNTAEVAVQRASGETVLREGIRFGEHIIWGATGRMLQNFLQVAFDAPVLPRRA